MPTHDEPPDSPVVDDCPLDERAQTRNVLLVGVITALNYLATPATYVWMHAPLCSRLGASATVANVPSTAYLALALTPVLVVWLFPSPAQFKPILIISNGLFALACAVVVGVLLAPMPDELKIAMLILHGAITGATMTTSVTIMFEVMGRGVSAKRRGQALALAYGVGPIFAVLASLASQRVLPQEQDGDTGLGLDFPWNYAVVFATCVPIMSLIALLSSRFVLPETQAETGRQPFWLDFVGTLRDFAGSRILSLVAVLAVLMFSGYHIMDNMTLYSRYALDAAPERYLGYQQAYRYTFKIASGFLLGALLIRTNPKVVLLVSATFGLIGIVWALLFSGLLYLVSFGWVGAGELFGPYVTNYILACSPAEKMRRNLAYSVLLLVFAFPAGPLFGAIADQMGAAYSRPLGFQLSFAVAASFVLLAIFMMLLLPARPAPEPTSASDTTSNQS